MKNSKKLKEIRKRLAASILGVSLGVTGFSGVSNSQNLKENPNNKYEWEAVDDIFEKKVGDYDVALQHHKYININIFNSYQKEIPYNNDTYVEYVFQKCENCGHLRTLKNIQKFEFTDWVLNKETGKETRICRKTGTIQNRYNVINNENKEENTNKIINNIGLTDPKEDNIKEEQKHEHNFEKIDCFDDKYEYSYCECGKVLKTKHELKFIRENVDGSKVFECTHEGCNYVTTIKKQEENTHVHNYILYKTDDEKEYWKCEKDGDIKEIYHNLKEVINNDGSKTLKCINDGCNFSKKLEEEHIHNYSKLKWADEEKEYWECEKDGNIKEIPHNFVIETNADGTKIKRCTHKDCVFYKELEEEHIHNYSLLSAIDENYEFWVCEKDGLIKEVPHNFVIETNADGTKVKKCINKGCSFSKELEEEHIHNYSKLKWADEEKEYWECEKDGDIKEIPHNFVIETNDDGTKIKRCTHEGCAFYKELEEEHIHDYSLLSAIDDNYEYWVCEKDGLIKEVPHNKIETIYPDGTRIITCTNEGCNYTKIYEPEHIHDYSKLDKVDEEKEYWVCEKDGDVKEIPHKLKETLNSDGSKTITCENPGCTYEKHIEPEHIHDYSKLDRVDDEKEYWVCEKDGDIKEVPHKLKETVNPDGSKTITCENPGCTYEKYIKPEHIHDYSKLDRVDEEKEYWICEKDGDIKEVLHKLKETVNPDGSKTITCENPGCTYEKYIKPEHIHDYSKLDRVDEEKEYWICEKDGDIKEVLHKLKETLNSDGSKTITCENPGCTYEKHIEPEHIHNYSKLNRVDENNEYWECEKDGDIKEVPHNLGQERYDKSTNEMVSDCLNGCGYSKRTAHEHNYSISSTDEVYEYLTCGVCGDETSRLHDYPIDGVKDKCTYTFTCTRDGCGQTKQEVHHSYSLSETIEYHGEDVNRCFTNVYSCSGCGDSYSEDMPHKMYVSQENIIGKTEKCENCSYEKYTSKLKSSSIKNDELVLKRVPKL